MRRLVVCRGGRGSTHADERSTGLAGHLVRVTATTSEAVDVDRENHQFLEGFG
jgi:hypothetical protein